MLNTVTLEWSIPLLNNTGEPKLAYHTATLVNKIMVLTFGMHLFFFLLYYIIT